MKIKSKTAQIFVAPLLLAFGLSAQAQLLNETFDSSAGFTVTDGNGSPADLFSDGFNDYFGIFDGDGDGGSDFGAVTTNPSGVPTYTNFNDNYLVNEDFDGEGGVLPFTITWDNIPLNGETFIEISADFASTRADADDYIIISYRLDGGSWVEILGVAGGPGFNGPVYEITDFSAQIGDTTATAITEAFTNVSTSFGLAGTETTLDIKAEFSNNNGDDNFAMDNLVVEAATPPNSFPPTDLAANAAAFPDNQNTITVDFTQNASAEDVLIVYAPDDTFGEPVDGVTYATDDSLPGGGTVLGVFSSSPASLTGLAPGQSFFFKAWSVNASDEYSSGIGSVSANTATFALQVETFADWTAVSVASNRDWSINGNSATLSNFGADVPAEDWLISPEINLDAFIVETFEFDYSSAFSDSIVGLELLYTDNYTGDPTTTTWTPFTTTNSEIASNSPSSASVDLSAISGSAVRVAFKYTSSGTGGGETRDWTVENPLISGFNSSDESITLSSAETDVDEGQSLTVTLSVPTNVSSDTDFLLTSNGDGSELSFPGTVTITSGTNSVDFTVNGLTDGALDGDNVVDLIANSIGYTVESLSITVNNIDEPTPSGDIIFTQYYEGDVGNNKWIEIANVGTTSVDLTGYEASLWRNSGGIANEEGWKVDGGSPEFTLDLSGVTLLPGQTYLIANPDTTIPFGTEVADATSDITFFGGNDSLVLYSDTAGYLTSNVVDAISFTTANEGVNKSYVRTLKALGFDFNIGSSIEDYDDDNGGPAVWTEITVDDANSATRDQDAYIGTTGLQAAPPSVRFLDSSQVLDEASGIATLTVQITNPDGNPVDVDITFDSGSSSAELNDIGDYTTQTVTFGASAVDGDTQTVSISLTDDSIEESTETAVFSLGNLVSTGPTIIALPSSTTIFIQDNDLVIPDLIISEVADPSDTFGARFVEIYNPGSSPVDLAAGSWFLARFVNASTSGSDVALTGTIPAGGTYIVANNATDFALYGTDPADQTSSVVSANGDDTYALFFGGDSEAGTLIDIYGEIGTDGTGEAWEFEDSRAYRNTGEVTPSDVWNASEWTIEPAAVADMSPGVYPEGSTGPVLPSYPITEDFSGTATWVNQAVGSSGFPWLIDSVDGRAEADGFADGGAEVVNNYLVSPAFDFTSVTDITLSFDYGEAFDGPDLELLYSTNYSGSGDPEAGGVIWTPISFTFIDSSTSETFSDYSSGNIALPSLLEGQTDVYFAFKYTADGTDTGSEQWYVDNIVVDAASATAPLDDYLTQRFLSLSDLETDTNGNGFTVIEEYFAGFGDGAGDDTIVYGIDPAGPALTLTSDLANDPDGVVVALFATSDLTTAFASVAFTTSSVDNGDGTFTRSYTETTPPSEADNRFYRLSITVEVD